MKKNNRIRTLLLTTVAASALTAMIATKAGAADMCFETTYNVLINIPNITDVSAKSSTGGPHFRISAGTPSPTGKATIVPLNVSYTRNKCLPATKTRVITVTFNHPGWRMAIECKFKLEMNYHTKDSNVEHLLARHAGEWAEGGSDTCKGTRIGTEKNYFHQVYGQPCEPGQCTAGYGVIISNIR